MIHDAIAIKKTKAPTGNVNTDHFTFAIRGILTVTAYGGGVSENVYKIVSGPYDVSNRVVSISQTETGKAAIVRFAMPVPANSKK